MVVGSDDWNAKERKGCEIWGKRHGRLESRARRRPLSERFFSVSLCRVGLGTAFQFCPTLSAHSDGHCNIPQSHCRGG